MPSGTGVIGEFSPHVGVSNNGTWIIGKSSRVLLTTKPSLQSSFNVPNINFLFNIFFGLVLSALIYPEITMVAR